MSVSETLEKVVNDKNMENCDGAYDDNGAIDTADAHVAATAIPHKETASETEISMATSQSENDVKDNYKSGADCNADNDEDLEDGEIDDDDDDNNNDTVTNVTPTSVNNVATETGTAVAIPNNSMLDEKMQQQQPHSDSITKIPIIDLSHEHTPSPTVVPSSGTATAMGATTNKSKKGQPLEDDHALNVENALLNVLKKKGIEPQIPKLLESRNVTQENEAAPGPSQSRSSRRRKRKRQRDEKDREKIRREKSRRYESPILNGPAHPDDDDMDEFEMLNVRGGSPPMGTHAQPLAMPLHYKDQYDSVDDSYSSDDSLESQGDVVMTGGGGGGDNGRRRRRVKKDRKRRDRRGRSREDEHYGGRQEKRSRRDSGDEKHRQEPRKLELCKFYLMECCAKKDKCSYMHADFPCKYYYLGMECVYKEECKFSHGEPLTDQLRNILLKHLETAPKEILGTFKRISRESAIAQMTKRHEELCKQFGVENTWSVISNASMATNRRGGGGGGGNTGDQMHFAQQRMQIQQEQAQPAQSHNTIPSLLDIVIKPPGVNDGPTGIGIGTNSLNAPPTKIDNHRKSRWADSDATGSMAEASVELPSYLNLKNLTGILSGEHIKKLSQLGIYNLEQVNLLTVGQLNQIGLSIAEISEIQKNAVNMAKLNATQRNDGQVDETEGTANTTETTPSVNATPTNRDVDMRFLSSASSTSAKDKDNTLDHKEHGVNAGPDKDVAMSSNSNSNSSSGVVYYSQYLKDSNLDGLDDERDEEQLVIDDGNVEAEENVFVSASGMDVGADADEQKHGSDFVGNSLNPFNRAANTLLSSKESKVRDRRSRNPFKTYHDDVTNDDDNDVYARIRMNSRSRSPSRSRSHTPTRSQSSTPEASQSPDTEESNAQPIYERSTMYDFNTRESDEDDHDRAVKSLKADKDMRFLQGSGGGSGLNELDLCLPFRPVPNYMPATEIDASLSSHLPITYKVYEIELPKVGYAKLRQDFKAAQTDDPRLRRILGLPELSQTSKSAALNRSVRKLSNNIASPESEGSPKHYTPPSSSNITQTTVATEERKQVKPSTTTISGSTSQPRFDPRRAAAQATNSATRTSASSSSVSTGNAAFAIDPATQQKNEIRRLLQNSEWYKNLNSKAKILVNQQVELLSSELRKFHQDTSIDKRFNFDIVSKNSDMLEIFTHLGVIISENGEVEEIDKNEQLPQGIGNINVANRMAMPNLSQPPPQLDYLRTPPPYGTSTGIPFIRQTGIPQAVMGVTNYVNPIAAGPGARPGLMGPGPPITFGNFPVNMPHGRYPVPFMPHGGYGLPGSLSGMGQRNQRNQQNRRNNFGGGGNNIL